MSSLSYFDREIIDKLFNEGGYVLNFSTDRFNSFTESSVGIRICDKYQLSKGKSLWEFCESEEDHLVKTLLHDLLRYYEINYSKKLSSDSEKKILFDQVREIERTLGESRKGLSGLISVFQEDFNSDYIDNQMNMMMDSIDKNPTEAIGKAKELIETCCITILENRGISIDKNWSVQQLSKQAVKSLRLTPEDIQDTAKASDTIRKLLSNLASICGYMAELRNPYGSGHGKSASYKGLSSRHARLAVGATASVVSFLWETYKEQKS